jgi:hypothetical protein
MTIENVLNNNKQHPVNTAAWLSRVPFTDELFTIIIQDNGFY